MLSRNISLDQLHPARKGWFGFAFSLILLSLKAVPSVAQETSIRFFGQPEFEQITSDTSNLFQGINPNTGQYYPTRTIPKTSFNNFNTGKLVLFITSQLNERLSVLAETSIYNQRQKLSAEVHRLMARYYVKDYFSVRFGKMFTPIGYWNNQYSLGLVLQPTIQRPSLIRTGSDGGLFQISDVGVQLEGDEISPARLSYRLLIGNGTGYYGSREKRDNHMAVTMNVGAEPIEGYKFSVSAQVDRFEKGKSNPSGLVPSLPSSGTKNLLLFSVAHMTADSKYELIMELINQFSNFNDPAIGNRRSFASYVYTGYKATSKIVPYAMYEYGRAGLSGRKANDADLYFLPVPAQIWFLTLGTRFIIGSNSVIKLEYNISNYTGYFPSDMTPFPNAAFENKVKVNAFRVQYAFAF